MKGFVCCVSILATACLSTASFSTSSPDRATSAPDGHVTVPNVFKLKKADAVAALRRAGIQGDIEDDTSLCGSTFDGKIIELGEVCYQHPAAGQVQGARLSVTLRVQTEDPRHGDVGQHTEWRLMPSLVGKTYEQALAEMHRAGFDRDDTIQHTIADDDPACKPGVVCRQYPEALVRAGLNDGKVLYLGPDPSPPARASSDPARPSPAVTPSPSPRTAEASSRDVPKNVPKSEPEQAPPPFFGAPAAPAPQPSGEPKHWGGNGAPPYRDGDNRVHGPGGPVFMGKGVPCTNKLDHCMRPGVWFAADNVIAGKLFRAVPAFQFETTWWTWRGEPTESKHLFRTSIVDKPDQLQVGKPVVFFSADSSERWLDNEYDMLTSSRWSVGVVDALSGESVHIQGWDNVPIETVRMIVEEKQQP